MRCTLDYLGRSDIGDDKTREWFVSVNRSQLSGLFRRVWSVAVTAGPETTRKLHRQGSINQANLAPTVGTSALHHKEDKNNSIDGLAAFSWGKIEPRAFVFAFSQVDKMLFYVSHILFLSDWAGFILWRSSRGFHEAHFRKSMWFVWECVKLWAAPVVVMLFFCSGRTQINIDFKIRKIPRQALTSTHLIYSHPNCKPKDLLPHSCFTLNPI